MSPLNLVKADAANDSGNDRNGGIPAEVRDRVQRLFEFLKRFEERRSPIRRDLGEADWRLYLSELPRHPVIKTGVGLAGDEGTEAGLVLSVERPQITDCPRPPSVLEGWLLDGWGDPARPAETRPARPLPDGSTEAFTVRALRLKAFSEWAARRASWSEVERPAREALAVFDRILALWAKLQREGGAVRVLLGDGHLLWKRNDDRGLVRHPLLLQEVELRFDERKRELAFIETESLPFLYSELLSTFDELDGDRRRVCRDLVDKAAESGSCSPLGGAETDEILRGLAALIGAPDKILSASSEEQPTATPSLQRNPVLLVVPRASGFRGAYEAFLERLPNLSKLPLGVSLTVGAAGSEPVRSEQSNEGVAGPDPEVELYFTKPANEAQERIARRLSARGAVLVQGPPGTGKTHTIANLIGHLLAEGKSILVTAQTSKALRVLREKVVDELKPLCVSLLDSDIESRAELEHAVNGIISRLTRDAREFERVAVARQEERRKLTQKVREKERDLRTAIHAEFIDIIVAGQGFHPSEAARQVAEGNGKHDWIPGLLEPGAPIPLAGEELAQLYRLNADLRREDEDQIHAGLPPIDTLMRPDDFTFISTALKSPLPHEPVERGQWEIPDNTIPGDRLERLLNQLQEATARVEKEPEWLRTCIHAALLGDPHQAPWDDMVSLLEQSATEIAACTGELLDFEVNIDLTTDADEALRAAEEMLAHLSSGGRIGFFSRIGKSSWTRTLEAAVVNGRQPRTATDVQAVRHIVRIEVLRRQLRRRWDGLLGGAGLPLEGPLRDRPEEPGLARLPELRRAIRWFREQWAACVQEMRSLGIPWERLLESTYAKPPHAELWRILKCAKDTLIPAIEREIEKQKRARLKTALERSKDALANFRGCEAARAALAAMESLDCDRYLSALKELGRIDALRAAVTQRDEHLRKLEKVAPGWADRIRSRRVPDHGPDAPGSAREAWLHRQFEQELDRRMALDADELQREVSTLKNKIQEVTCSLVENKAWTAQARRTNAEQHRALMAWLDLVKRVGKGTGKRTDEFRRSARKQLEVARAAVPVWIMPLSRVAESFIPGEKLFDVVVLDEASQCDMSALIAFALGKTVVVVGDDEQVSPLDIGQNVDVVRALQEELLEGFRDRDLFDGKASAYEIGRRSFPGGLIRLIEHFRCVPDIIAFSNTLSYKDEIRPLRESSSAKVFPPVVAHRAPEGERAANAKANRVEALELASLVIAASELPEYAGLELGVISLLGDEQAREIDSLLQRFLDPLEYKKRRIICGTAAHFQGDERHVVFLSMVDSPQEGPHRLLDREDMKKRYNVAASRARDQMWVVHSLDPEKDLKPGDLRRRLLEHALNPSAWRRRLENEKKVESEFERQVLRHLRDKNFLVHAQVEVGAYRLDLVVQGKNRRIAIECDGDRFHSLESLDNDLERQAILERLGWTFIRIRGSAFFRSPSIEMGRVFKRLEEFGIEPLGEAPDVLHGVTEANDVRERVVQRAAVLRREWLERSGSLEDLFAQAVPGRAGRGWFRNAKSRSSGSYPVMQSLPIAAAAETPDSYAPRISLPKGDSPAATLLGRGGVRGSNGASEEEKVPLTSSTQPSDRGNAKPRSLLVAVTAIAPALVSPRCPKCSAGACLEITKEGVVITCKQCRKTARLSASLLQRVSDSLGIACYSCGQTDLVSVERSFGVILRCPRCNSNNQWTNVNERLFQRKP
jgi:very-short-patch-repair endonuclease/DNA polymerase III delta prime subunit